MKEFKLTINKTKFEITLEDGLLCLYTPIIGRYNIILNSRIEYLKNAFKYGQDIKSSYIVMSEKHIEINAYGSREKLTGDDYLKFITWFKYILDYKKIDRRNKINNINNA